MSQKLEFAFEPESPSYLVFGDLHGRVLPAFTLAKRFMDDFHLTLDGLLQVGDLGYYPDLSRLDSATRRHAATDPLELGISELNSTNRRACRLFSKLDISMRLFFTAGNHEDHDCLERWRQKNLASWPVDEFQRLWCIDDGKVETLPHKLRVGSLWGIDGDASRARRIKYPRMQIAPRSADQLATANFDVLLSHESPRDAVWMDSGSLEISYIISEVQPSFAFFGHYHEPGQLTDRNFQRTRVYWMNGFELKYRGGAVEPYSVGLLQRVNEEWTFQYLPTDWLCEFRRENWHHWVDS